jgi:hypothetical protein
LMDMCSSCFSGCFTFKLSPVVSLKGMFSLLEAFYVSLSIPLD